MKINRNEKSIIVEFENDWEFMEGLFFEVLPDKYINPNDFQKTIDDIIDFHMHKYEPEFYETLHSVWELIHQYIEYLVTKHRNYMEKSLQKNIKKS